MQITIIVTLSVGVVIAVVLYVVAVRRRAKGKSVPEGKNELRQDEAQPTVQCEASVQTQVSERVQPKPEVPSAKVESKLPDAPEVAHPLGERPQAAAEAGLTVLPQQAVPEPPEPGPGVTEKEKPREVEPTSEVQPTQAVTEAHTEKPREGAEGPKPMTSANNASASTTEPTNGRAEEASPERGKRPVQDAKRISPEKRGGRSRTAVEQSEEEQTSKGRPRTPKPEIVCWKREREWVLAVEIPEELHTVSVFQNGMRLTEDELEKGCWRLAILGGEVVVSTLENERESQFKITLGGENHLLFKLSGVDQNQGRHVKRPTCGSYLVVVPADWKRDEELAGAAPAKPEDVCLEAYRAHFFYLGTS